MNIAERPLGRTGLSTTPLMLGGNVFGWTADRDSSFAVLDAFVAGGGKLIDTADMYSNWIPGLVGGESENMIGEWQASRGCRDKILIATKVGRGTGDVAGLSRRSIFKAIDASLQRLRTDYVDLYFAHLDDVEVALDETLQAFDDLVRAGKVRAVGASHYSAERLLEARSISRAMGLAHYEVLQPRYNLLSRDTFEGPLQQVCIENNIGVVPFYALASGFLTGKHRSEKDLSERQRGAEVAKYINPFGLGVLAALDTVTTQTGASQAQVALAWLMAQPGITAPIASATTPAQIDELMRAMRLQLSAEQLVLLDTASAPARR
ncbi:aldo/keto reductase [Noviherbaspirillum sedimenti]|uniref:Aldo/keto reductase n=1 Tax=Noviherbaspirillum sedimenti TaxID=2320865 RepID=A0A3A3G6R8_9BURK|nr:aldo/keto reductase [Noviherbaspirillum sedimenti]RJG03335.1 aldo/keto reductase [Noviherbaspirillum sedimenti]